MNNFITQLKNRNRILYWYGLLCLASAAVCGIMIFSSSVQVLGINAFIKPFKFFLSTGIFSFSMGWLMYYLEEEKKVRIYNWLFVFIFSFELGYIALQASRGQLSHFNISTPVTGLLFSLMGVAISIITLFTGYIAFLFFKKSFPHLPQPYVWGIRLGLVMFVIFAFEGGVMAAFLSHTVGSSMTETPGLPLLNWSKVSGDLRVAHFFGMHALQLLPLLGFYFFKSKNKLVLFSIVYFLFVCSLLWQALQGVSLFF